MVLNIYWPLWSKTIVCCSWRCNTFFRNYTARKTTFCFSRRLEKMIFLKIALEYDLPCIIGKDDFSFPENMIIPPDRKWKMIFLKKKLYENMILSSNVLKRWSFEKRLRWTGSIFFPKRLYFSLGGKWERERERERERDDLFQEIHENIFPTQQVPSPTCLKDLKTILSPKNIPKGDWHSRSTP